MPSYDFFDDVLDRDGDAAGWDDGDKLDVVLEFLVHEAARDSGIRERFEEFVGGCAIDDLLGPDEELEYFEDADFGDDDDGDADDDLGEFEDEAFDDLDDDDDDDDEDGGEDDPEELEDAELGLGFDLP